MTLFYQPFVLLCSLGVTSTLKVTFTLLLLQIHIILHLIIKRFPLLRTFFLDILDPLGRFAYFCNIGFNLNTYNCNEHWDWVYLAPSTEQVATLCVGLALSPSRDFPTSVLKHVPRILGLSSAFSRNLCQRICLIASVFCFVVLLSCYFFYLIMNLKILLHQKFRSSKNKNPRSNKQAVVKSKEHTMSLRPNRLNS